MFDLIARVLAFFYDLPVVGGSYGFAIILLTATVMMLLMPLTLKATRSTIKMQVVQPKLRELQKKHQGDRATLNAELMELYKREGINPVGGCLPMLAQLPVFLVLFNVLRGLSRRISETPFFGIAEHARLQAGGAPVVANTFEPKYLDAGSQMSIDLHRTSEMGFGPFDLARHPIDVLQESGVLAGLPYVILILFVVATSFYQQRQISSRRTGVVMNPQQEMILKFLPLMSGIWSFAFPAGLVLYWATSNVFRIGQQSYITRAFYSDADREASAEASGEAAGTAKKSTDSKATDSAEDGSSGATSKQAGSKYRDGRSPRTRSGPQAPKASTNGSAGPSDPTDSNGSGAEGDASHGKMKVDRERAWEQRRREKARAQAVRQSRPEQSSRITPKGTKPGDPKKKRKR